MLMEDAGKMIRIFWVGVTLDMTHCLHMLYFVISIVGMFYKPIMAILMLDIVFKVPILGGVLLAIVKNRY